MVGQTISHYTILEKLGEGGMGVVYKARDTKLDRLVAVKFLPSQLSASAENKARFVQEAQAAASLNHPNILAVYDIDELEGQTFFVMEYVDGKTLKSHLTSVKSGVSIPQALDWAMQIAQGLKAAHAKAIVHRDIKSDNLMMTGDRQLKIMDFGIAKLRGNTGLTKSGGLVGTLSYMSPEQAQGTSADERSDIWSMGVVLYEMLTGDLPFKAEHEAATSYLILNQQQPAPSVSNGNVPHQLDAVVQKMLEKDRATRYQSAGEVLSALQDVRQQIEGGSEREQTKVIAVLPFDNIGADKESDYFSDGLTEELITSLSKLKEIQVVSRTSSMQYKGTKKDSKTIGRELGARYLMEGGVRRSQDNLRITAQLIDVQSDTHLWAETYKGKLADVFDIQEQVSKQIVDALKVRLTPSEKVVLTKRSTENPEAFDCNLRGRNFLYRRTKNSIQLAIQLFQKAIALDTRYASAYAGLGEAFATLYRDFDRQEKWLDSAQEVSLKALMYDASSSDAYATIGLAYFGKKQFDEALKATQKAIELDVNNFNAYWLLARINHTSGNDLEGVKALEKAIELKSDFYEAYDDLRMYYERIGNTEKHRSVIQKLMEIYPRYLSQNPDDAYRRMAYAVTLAIAGKTDEARQEGTQALELSFGDPVMMYYGACLYARIGRNGEAVESLRNAVNSGYENFEWIKADPDFGSIRNEPGYIELMKGK